MPQVTGFSASQVPQLVTDLETLWPDARANEMNPRFNADLNALRAVWNEQTAELLSPLTENNSCKPIKLQWLESGDHTVVDGETTNHTAVTCNIDGPEGASNSIEYQITKFKAVTLRVKKNDCGNNYTRDDKFRHLMHTKLIDLANSLATQVPYFLEEKAGVSIQPGQLGTYAKKTNSTDDDKTLLRIPAGNLNAFDFVPYVQELADFNRFNNPAVFDGGNLRYQRVVADAQQGKYAGDAGAKTLFDDLRIYSDSRNFIKDGLADRTYLVDRGALALYTAHYLPTREDVSGNGFAETQYLTPLLGLQQPGVNGGMQDVMVDTIYRMQRQPITPGNALCDDYYVWEMKLWYILIQNPLLSQNDGVNGIIRLKRDASLTQIGTPMQAAL